MNDISVKIVETPNETVTCAESVQEEIFVEKDPLAIDDVEVSANVVAGDVKAKVCDEPRSCDGINTKDVNNDCEAVVPVVLQTLSTQLIKEELQKEDTLSINSSLDESDILCGVEIDDNEISSLAGSPSNKEVSQEPEENCVEVTETVVVIQDDNTSESIEKETLINPIETTKSDDNKKENAEIIKCLESTDKLEEKIPKETPIESEKILDELNKDSSVKTLEHAAVDLKSNTETEVVCKKAIEVVNPIEVSAVPENTAITKNTEEPVSIKQNNNIDETVPVVKEAKSGTYEKKSIERIISDLEKQSALQIKPLKRPAEEISIVPQKRLLLDHKPGRQKEKTSPVEEKTAPVFDNKSNLDQKVPEENKLKEVLDVGLTEMKEDKTDDKVKNKNDTKALNGDCIKEETSKRRGSEDSETDSPLKKLCQDIERSYPGHDGMLTDYIQNATKNNVDEIQRHTEQLLAEIQTLRELAQKKEHEWNNILHLKKVKEEILLRLLRQKQVLAFEKSVEINGTDRSEPYDFFNQHKGYAIDKSDEISGVAIKPPCNPPMQAPVMPVSSHYSPMSVLPPPYDKAAHMHNMQKNMYPGPMMMPTMPGFPRDMNGQMPNFGLPMGRQGPTKDVKSIIADYRQRNPDVSPRRGRRMKSILNPNMMNPPRPHHPKGVEGLNTMNSLNNLGMIFNNLDMNQKAMLERLSQMQTTTLPNGLSFKDVLVQFANMQPQNMQPQNVQTQNILIRPEMMPTRPDHHSMRSNEMNTRNMGRRVEKPSTPHEEVHVSLKSDSRHASPSPRLPPPPPYPEISLLPVASSNNHDQPSAMAQQNSLLHGILTKQGSSASQSFSPTLAKLLTSPERKQATTLPSFGQAKNCGEITITPVQPTPPPQPVEPVPVEKSDEVVQLDEEEATSDGSGCGSGEGEERRLVIDEGTEEAPLCQGCRRRDAQFVCAGCANQWYCSRDCQVAAWDEHSDMCSG